MKTCLGRMAGKTVEEWQQFLDCLAETISYNLKRNYYEITHYICPHKNKYSGVKYGGSNSRSVTR